MSPQEALSQASCVACLSNADQETLITLAALAWLAFTAADGVRPVTPISPQEAFDLPNGPCAACISYTDQQTIITSTALLWISLVINNETRPLPTVSPQEAFDLPIGPCSACLSPADQQTLEAYNALVQLNWLQETNMSPQEALSSAGCVACLNGADQQSIQTIAALETIEYVNDGGCPPGTNPPVPVPVDILYGNYTWPDAPAAAPTFTEANFIGVNALYVDRQTRSTTTRNGNYEFPARAGVRQVMVIPQELGAPTFTVSGFPWQLDPAANNPVQTGLTVNGKVCDVYFTSQQNTGGNTIAGGNPVVIT